MKVIAFAASMSSTSINKQLVTYAVSLLKRGSSTVEVDVLDLNDYALPIYTQDREKEMATSNAGYPQAAKDFLAAIFAADALVISFAEHNGSYTAAYKNLFDWCSRIEQKVFRDKAMVLLATSPGKRGGATVLAAAVASVPHFGGEVKASLSIPSFHENFDLVAGKLTNPELDTALQRVVGKLL